MGVWEELNSLVNSVEPNFGTRAFVVGGYAAISDDCRVSIKYFPLVGKYDVIRHKKPVRKGGWESSLTGYFDDCFEEIIEEEHKVSSENKEKNVARSIRRIRSTCRELLLCNPWEYWITFTVSEQNCNRYDFKEVLKLFLSVVKRRNERLKNCEPLRYLIFPEEHKKGGFHFHGFIMGLDSDELVVNEYGYLDIPLFSKNIGFVNVCPVRPLPQNERYGLLMYTMKYAQKNAMSRNEDISRGYYRSDGLKRAETLVLPPSRFRGEFAEIHGTVASFENEYVEKHTYNEADLAEILGLLSFSDF